MVCDMLDRMPVRYIALDSSPIKAIEARGKGLPVFYGMLRQRTLLLFLSTYLKEVSILLHR